MQFTKKNICFTLSFEKGLIFGNFCRDFYLNKAINLLPVKEYKMLLSALWVGTAPQCSIYHVDNQTSIISSFNMFSVFASFYWISLPPSVLKCHL